MNNRMIINMSDFSDNVKTKLFETGMEQSRNAYFDTEDSFSLTAFRNGEYGSVMVSGDASELVSDLTDVISHVVETFGIEDCTGRSQSFCVIERYIQIMAGVRGRFKDYIEQSRLSATEKGENNEDE